MALLKKVIMITMMAMINNTDVDIWSVVFANNTGSDCSYDCHCSDDDDDDDYD